MENFIKKATEFLASKTDVNAVCVTTDGSVFLVEMFLFADSHSQNLKDNKIVVLSYDEKHVEKLNKKFFEGSKWELKLVEKPTQKKPPKKKKEVKEPQKK